MHPSSMSEMSRLIQTHLMKHWETRLRVLDVGSKMVNINYRHSYRELLSQAWGYTGCDVSAGDNVDLIQDNPDVLPIPEASFDVVISGQCLEHVEHPWLLVKEMARALKGGGLLLITAPWRWNIHRYPLDCWRILPDGMTALMRDAGLEVYASYTVQDDCWGIARKP